jgi:serine/threonine-protein kinase HipA
MKTIYVYWDDAQTVSPLPVGRLYADVIRGKEVFSFEFVASWLKQSVCRHLDPDLQLFGGPQYVSDKKPNFGAFTDSCPDRWGRVLIERRESVRAKEEGRSRRTMMESDFLLGVHDETRMGALRFKIAEDGPFLDDEPDYAAPPLASLRELQEASWHLENDDDADMRKWLQILLAPGSSLGGARPKANIRKPDGSLWIAKFPSQKDRTDVGAWEAVAMTLASRCGVEVAPFEIVRYGQYATFTTRRFDRNAEGKRLHFTSAMSMLGYADGQTDGCSYLEIAEWISRYSAQASADLIQMWRRIVFNIAISNCDDHLRNHGFLLTEKGWRLSPAYDLNPSYYGGGLSLNITEDDNSLDMDLAREVAPFFGVSEKNAETIIGEVHDAVSGWRRVASKLGISRAEQELMGRAFSNVKGLEG